MKGRGAALAVAALAVAALAGCGGGGNRGSSPAPKGSAFAPGCPPGRTERTGGQPGSNLIAVTGRARQTIRGWGASVVGDTYVEPLVDPVGLTPAQLRTLDVLVFRKAGIDLVRVFGPGYGRTAVTATGAALRRDRRLAFMRRVAPLGVRFMWTGADAPAPLKDGRRLAAGSEAAYARYIAGQLRFARDANRTPFAYAAIANEPDNPVSLLTMTPRQTAAVYAALAGELRRQRLTTRLVFGDDTGWNTACRYARAQLASPAARRAAVAVASHGYRGRRPDARGVARDARRSGLEVWQTEWGTGCTSCPEDNSMHRALGWSHKIVSNLENGQASAWFTFRAVALDDHGPGDALIVRRRSDRRSPWLLTRRFFVFRQYTSAAPPGARRLDVRERVPGVFSVAFRTRRRVALVVTNERHGPARVRLALGTRRGAVLVRRTSEHESFAALPALRAGGRALAVTLPAQSVTTYSVAAAR